MAANMVVLESEIRGPKSEVQSPNSKVRYCCLGTHEILCLGRLGLPERNELAYSALGLNFGPRRRAERVRAHRKLAGQLSATQDFDACAATVGQPRASQGRFIHARAVFETVQRLQIHRQIPGGMTGVVKTALGNAPD